MKEDKKFDIYEVFGTQVMESLSEKQRKAFQGSKLLNTVWTDPPSDAFQEAFKDEKNGDYKLMHMMIRDGDGNEVMSVDEFKKMGTLRTTVLRNKVAKITGALVEVLVEGRKIEEETESEEGKSHS